MKFLPALFLLSCIAASGCESDTEPETTNVTISDLLPLEVGNTWKLLEQSYRSDGTLWTADTITVSVDSTGTDRGHAGYYVTFNYKDFFYYYDDTFLQRYRLLSGTPEIYFNYPINEGEDFTAFDTIQSDSSRIKVVHRVMSKSIPITVPAGTFTCIWYRVAELYGNTPDDLDTNDVNEYYLAPGVGIIRHNSFTFINSSSRWMNREFVLLSHVLK